MHTSILQHDGGMSRDLAKSEIKVFFDKFARILASGDGAAAIPMWRVPALIITNEDEQLLRRRDEIRAFVESAKIIYSEIGVEEVRPNIIYSRALTENLIVTEILWNYLDADGHTIGAEINTYTLQRDREGTFRIRTLLRHGGSMERAH